MTMYSASSDLEAIAARRRLMRWRVVSVMLFLLACVAWFARGPFLPASSSKKPHIARLAIHGVIRNDVSRLTKALERARTDKNVVGLLLSVDSPGGGVTGGERLHDAVAEFSKVKPVSVSMGDMGASAGYMLSVPAQHIVAYPSTLTGSIGVLLPRLDVSSFLSRWGIAVEAITSGAMKDQTDPTSPLTPQGRVMLQGLVNDLYEQFVVMVAEGRHMPLEKVKSLADGRAYTGRQAVSLGLIDAVGSEADAKKWLCNRLKLPADFPVAPLLKTERSPWQRFTSGRRAALEMLLGTDLAQLLLRRGAVLWLDGPVAMLQP